MSSLMSIRSITNPANINNFEATPKYFLDPIASNKNLVFDSINNNQDEFLKKSSTPKKRHYSEITGSDYEELSNKKRVERVDKNRFSTYVPENSQANCQYPIDKDNAPGDFKEINPFFYFIQANLEYIEGVAEIENSLRRFTPSSNENSYSICELIETSQETCKQIVQEFRQKVISPRYDTLTGGPLKLLSGKLTHVPLPDDTPEKLRENLQTAKKIIRFVHEAIPFSQNYLQRSKIFFTLQSSYRDFVAAFNLAARVTMSVVCANSDIRHTLKQVVSQVTPLKLANCMEMGITGLLFSYAKNEPRNCSEMLANGFDEEHQWAPVELFGLLYPEGNHAFLVIDRDRRIAGSDYPLWGKNAVICDVWTGAHYPASKIKEHLLDYVAVTNIDQIPYTVVQNFDPSKQSLRIYKPYLKIQ